MKGKMVFINCSGVRVHKGTVSHTQQPRLKSGPGRKAKKCYNCSKFGHLARDCRRPAKRPLAIMPAPPSPEAMSTAGTVSSGRTVRSAVTVASTVNSVTASAVAAWRDATAAMQQLDINELMDSLESPDPEDVPGDIVADDVSSYIHCFCICS
uniref:CCHC-type domain-containing protein n=1 Tax=Schizaphis graminum TaxID=13262 RepID=A0A2S2N6N3_SCHGA